MVSRNQLGRISSGLEFHFHQITHVSLSIFEGPFWTSTFVSWSELREFCDFINDYLPNVKSAILLINITEADFRKVMAHGQNIEWVAAVQNLAVKERFEAKLHFVKATLPESSIASAEEALIKLLMPLCLRQSSVVRDNHVDKPGDSDATGRVLLV
ncbi:hypothetical protein B7494_g6458 [Chlorociboria aeruginascens]|nr:hypothetical protein B7494_g6458 [Chlorociboria aeruginascens]